MSSAVDEEELREKHIAMLHRETEAMIREITELRSNQAELLDVLEGVLLQACGVGRYEDPDYHLDSMALSYYADGIRVLAKHGLLKIDVEYGRRVIAVLP